MGVDIDDSDYDEATRAAMDALPPGIEIAPVHVVRRPLVHQPDIHAELASSRQRECAHGDNCACAVATRHEWMEDAAASRQRVRDLEDKALRYDLDQSGITRREVEAVELVELRAEVAELKTTLASREAALRNVPALLEAAFRDGWNEAHLGSYRQPTMAWDNSKTKRAAQEVGRG